MANTTFTGPVRSEGGFKVVTKSTTTGAITENMVIDQSGVTIAPVALSDADTTATAAANANRINVVPDGGQDNTITLPAPTAGAHYTFIYGGGAADGTDAIFDTGSNTNFYIGGVTFLDTDGNAISSVFSDGDSNSIFQINVPESFEVHFLGLDATNYQVWGYVTSTTAPAFSDQA